MRKQSVLRSHRRLRFSNDLYQPTFSVKVKTVLADKSHYEGVLISP